MKKPSQCKPVVFIVDDDVDLCRSLQFLLESVGLTVQVFSSGVDFLETFQPVSVGCILLDIRMPLMSGLQLQERLSQKKNTLPIIFMTGHGDIPMAVRAMRAGAFDFLTKPFNDQAMLDQIQRAIEYYQKKNLSSDQYQVMQARFASLSNREREIVRLIVAGKLNKVIASELGISMKTVELHRSQAMRKMRATTAAELVKFYLLANREELVD